ncbi:MAG: RraA family protein [Euryarchaeota archaeon]|jgi:3-hexulose-6-phosphate synthase|uniref:RraA family protein n=1 Tax=Methanobacterium sp. MZD130B TaxID=3394378 RepID=UPI0009C6B42A|nr:RraA family protein [Euryarchaeota archaeon]OPZ94566.1 MAG: 4-hydroxy-4-methyl-2-oxoglutarate aldolase [Firmicutes bacterium ADurb.Bin419]HHT19409.1 RraA family protein [Methanobacterium sp.]
MTGKIEVSTDYLLKKFSSKKYHDPTDVTTENVDVTTSQISDALKNLTGKYGVIQGVKPIKKNLKINGRVVTVKTKQNDWGTPLKAIENAQKNDIIFISCDGDEIAVWGELFSKYSQKRGLGGTVIFGAMRDIEAVYNLDYPVFSRAIVPNAGEPKANGETNINLECSGVKVKPGDWIFGDDCGVVVIDKELVDNVIEEAVKIKMNEDEILSQLEEGAFLSDILSI